MPKWTKLQRSFLRSSDSYQSRYIERTLEYLVVCLVKDRPVPAELKTAFIAAVKAGVRGHIKSWDEVFGRPTTSQAFDEFDKDLTLAPEVERLADQAKGHLSEDRFEEIGKEFGLGGSTKTKEVLSWWRQFVADHSQTPTSPKPSKKSP